MMNPRTFLCGLTLGTLFAALVAEAQPAEKVYRIGYLSPGSGIEYRDEGFRQALGQRGYVDGRNLVIEWRFTKGRPVALELAARLTTRAR